MSTCRTATSTPKIAVEEPGNHPESPLRQQPFRRSDRRSDLQEQAVLLHQFRVQPIGQASAAAPILAPTAAGYTTLAGIAGLNQNNVAGLKAYAVAPSACTAAQVSSGVCTSTTVTVNGNAIPVGVIPVAAPNYQNGEFITSSVDYHQRQGPVARSLHLQQVHQH